MLSLFFNPYKYFIIVNHKREHCTKIALSMIKMDENLRAAINYKC